MHLRCMLQSKAGVRKMGLDGHQVSEASCEAQAKMTQFYLVTCHRPAWRWSQRWVTGRHSPGHPSLMQAVEVLGVHGGMLTAGSSHPAPFVSCMHESA